MYNRNSGMTAKEYRLSEEYRQHCSDVVSTLTERLGFCNDAKASLEKLKIGYPVADNALCDWIDEVVGQISSKEEKLKRDREVFQSHIRRIDDGTK